MGERETAAKMLQLAARATRGNGQCRGPNDPRVYFLVALLAATLLAGALLALLLAS